MDASLHVVDSGFADPVMQSQAVFRAMLDAMAKPASQQRVAGLMRAPKPLSPVAAALAATLLDADTPVWLGPTLALQPAVKAWIAFHTSARVVANPGEALFAFCADPAQMPTFDNFAQGTQEYPDRSATIILQVGQFEGGDELSFEGPGIASTVSFAPDPMPRHFREQWLANRKRFPRGVDLVLAGPADIAALPRTARLIEREV